MIPYGRQSIGEDDIAAVVSVLQSDFLTQGPAVPAFEQAVATYCGTPHAVATNSATSALHLACLALGVGPGSRVWTSPISFVASSNCALYCGAAVDFVDIDLRSLNMSTEALAAKLAEAERSGTLPDVVIPVHMAGQSCDMAAIHDLGRRYGFRIVEDASHAIGARYSGKPVGDCRFSDIAVFSFHPVKIITTAEGGMAMTRDPELARRLGLFRSHGITRDPRMLEGKPEGDWTYEQQELGFNYRLTDLQAALGLAQMARLDSFVAARQALADRYDALLESMPVRRPWRMEQARSSWHLYIVTIEPGGGASRGAVFARLRSAGIGVNVHYIPIYLQPYYRRLGFEPGLCPAAEDYYAGALTIPLYPALSNAEQDSVAAALARALAE